MPRRGPHHRSQAQVPICGTSGIAQWAVLSHGHAFNQIQWGPAMHASGASLPRTTSGMDDHRVHGHRLLAFGSAVVATTALILAGGAPPATAADGTWYVDATAGTDGPDCGEAPGTDACATIGAALTLAPPDDIVSIAAGDYDEALTIATPVTLQGAGADEVTLTNLAPDSMPAVLIDAAAGAVTIADIGFTDDNAMPSSEPAIRIAADSTAMLSGISITGDELAPAGAGVVADAGSTVTIDGATITGVGTGVAVGDIALVDPAPAMVTINSSTIAAELTGVAVTRGVATITGGTVSGRIGGGLFGYSSDAAFNVTGTSIIDSGDPSGGTFRGGVVIYDGGTFTGEDVTISGNDNGMMLPDGGDVTLINSTVSDNTGASQSAGIWGRTDTTEGESIPLTVSITGTEITGHAFGVNVEHGQTQISDSTIANNETGVQAIASLAESSLELTNSAVTDNDGGATDDGIPGAGLYLDGPVDAVVTDTELSRNILGLFAGYADVTMTGGVVADNEWAGVFAVEEPHSQRRTTIDLTGTQITGNGLDPHLGSAFGFGGIALRFSATVTGHDLTITGNAGGAMVQGGSLSLTDSIISDNVRTDLDDLFGVPITGYGAIVGPTGSDWPGDIELVRTEVSTNARSGLRISTVSSGLVLSSTIAGNGGFGISTEAIGDEFGDIPAAPLLLAGSTVADNAEGGLVLSEDTTATAIASIVHSPDGAPACEGDLSNLTDGGFNVASDDTCELDADTSVVADPLLEPLGDNGGPSRTVLPGSTSPAVNLVPTGSTAPWSEETIELCPGGVDQRGDGYPRLVASACDAGAVERSGGVITVTAGDATTYEGAFEPEVTASYTGFWDDDTIDDLDTLPTCGYDMDAATTFCSDGADDSYTFEYVNGTLTLLDPLVIVTDSLPDGTVGEEYSVTLEADGGNGGPYTWGMFEGDLPAGLDLDTETGEISGTPEAAGDVTFTVFVGDPITAEFTLSVAPAPTDPPTEPTNPPTSEPTNPPTSEPTNPPTSEPTNPPTSEPTDTDPGQEMPDTGANVLLALAASATLLVLGAALLALRQQRHQRQLS
ncbi:right-handed parallel beta-helix repeat-containing protein [Ruania alkalisoli]|uniref:Right-handed parallel beta-helix repeat-containing protein n=1 Tax=Ruania alkalisoli TaxID=2779775 RepID=A0A7M1SWI1_9MICO|nr:right-handed parallel beta-helix repeat-containing protein [Ruania alkalisoli]QOR71841.1 right-handed parallel beta-helix repeat-containing protein [Ruania alkalisoli]